jgi:hypothetical protein
MMKAQEMLFVFMLQVRSSSFMSMAIFNTYRLRKRKKLHRDRHSHKRERERAYLLGFIEIDIAAMLAEEVSSDSRLETNCGSDIQSNDKGWRG